MIRTRSAAILSVLFTVAFFLDYTPLRRRVHIPFDLVGFHYPLADYAFQTLRSGQFPQWDWAAYCGVSFVGNAQAALFYPPTWLMFALNWNGAVLPYQSLQNLALAHVWLAFFLCYLWMWRQKGLHALASALGAGVFAFSGFMLLQLQHFGVLAGYAWMPLGFSAIDAADAQGRFRPMWKLAAASAMCLLAGYPPMWVVFAICMLGYACGRKSGLRWALWASAALSGSLLLSAVQLLPSWDASRMAVQEARYGVDSGIREASFFISYFAPNYYDFGLDVPVHAHPGRSYFYLGAAALAGLALLVRRGIAAGMGPPLAVLLASLLFAVNPFGVAGAAIERSPFLAQVFSAWYFLAGLTASASLFAALGLDYALRRASRPAPSWLAVTAVILALAWCIRLAIQRIPAGWLSGIDALAATILLGLLILIYPGSSGRLRTATAAAILILAAADYRVFGTGKRFNAAPGLPNADFASEPFPALDRSIYETLKRSPQYRVALDQTTIFPQELRHNGLSTPQGFDPLIPVQYKALVDRIAISRTTREFDLIPEDEAALRLFGVRYYVSSEQGPLFARLSAIRHFRKLEPDNSYHKVFEYTNARPAFGWEEEDDGHAAALKRWTPERRAFEVRSASGGRFRLTEQFFTGWTAYVDGKETPIHRCHEAFQCIAVAPGEHRVEFRYRSRWLVAGAAISVCSLLLTLLLSRDSHGAVLLRRKTAP